VEVTRQNRVIRSSRASTPIRDIKSSREIKVCIAPSRRVMPQGYGKRKRRYIGVMSNFCLFGSGSDRQSLFLFFHVALFRDRKIGAALFKKIFFYRVDSCRSPASARRCESSSCARDRRCGKRPLFGERAQCTRFI